MMLMMTKTVVVVLVEIAVSRFQNNSISSTIDMMIMITIASINTSGVVILSAAPPSSSPPSACCPSLRPSLPSLAPVDHEFTAKSRASSTCDV